MKAGLGSARAGAGFTLVELLLALTLMGMLMALAYGGLRASARATDRGQTILEDSGRIRMAHQFVHRQLNQISPLAFAVDEESQERVVFVGESDRIRYVAPMPGYLGFGGPQVQELALTAGDDGLELVLSHALLQAFEEAMLYDRPPISLLGGIQSARFSFLGRDENGELAGWSSTWTDRSVLPESIALEIELGEEVYSHWPLLTASVRIDPNALTSVVDGGIDGGAKDYDTAIQELMNRRGRRRR